MKEITAIAMLFIGSGLALLTEFELVHRTQLTWGFLWLVGVYACSLLFIVGGVLILAFPSILRGR